MKLQTSHFETSNFEKLQSVKLGTLKLRHYFQSKTYNSCHVLRHTHGRKTEAGRDVEGEELRQHNRTTTLDWQFASPSALLGTFPPVLGVFFVFSGRFFVTDFRVGQAPPLFTQTDG